MKYCEHCGGKLDSNAEYCPNCGAKVDKKEVVNGTVVDNSSNKAQVKDNTVTALVCSVIGALCCTYVAIPGLILSITSLKDMKDGKISSERKWMAIVGIIFSVIGVVQLFYNLMYPAHNQEIVNNIMDKLNIPNE
ncbi:MAG: DUF4190 domain-containing protein [Bacilli bacterium]|nr:DUF4190 domain-containing protein [Bacilli bacterium]